MKCVLFAKMGEVFSKENKTLKKILEKSGNFVSPEKWEPCSESMQCEQFLYITM